MSGSGQFVGRFVPSGAGFGQGFLLSNGGVVSARPGRPFGLRGDAGLNVSSDIRSTRWNPRRALPSSVCYKLRGVLSRPSLVGQASPLARCGARVPACAGKRGRLPYEVRLLISRSGGLLHFRGSHDPTLVIHASVFGKPAAPWT